MTDDAIVPAETKAVSVTVNRRGEIVGDTSQLDPEILAQLQTPEAQAKIRAQYREAHDCGGRRELHRSLNSRVRIRQEPRDFRHLTPPGMDRETARRLRKKVFRDLRKQAIAQQRRSYANQPISDQHASSGPGEQHD